MGFEDLTAEPEKESLPDAESFLLKKLDTLLPGLMSLSTRVAMLEGQIAFLLSKDAEYVAALDAYEKSQKEEKNEEPKN
jgi:hypothetical protein